MVEELSMSVDEAIEYIEAKITSYEEKLEYYRNLTKTDATFRNELNNYQLMNVTPIEQLEYYQTAFELYFPPLTSKPEITVKYIDKAMEEHFSPAAYMVSAIDNTTEEFIYLNGADITYTKNTLNYIQNIL